MEKDGTETGRTIEKPLVEGFGNGYIYRGLTFDATGDGNLGSIYAVTLRSEVGILELNLEFNPDSSWGYSLLGEARSRQGDVAAARKGFEKALELEPENSFARQRLQELDASRVEAEPEGGVR